MASNVSESVTITVTAETEQVRAAFAQVVNQTQVANQRMAQSTKAAGAAGAAAGKQFAGGFQAAATALETVARTGRLTGEAARTAVTQIAGAMAPFLPGGVIISGIGIVTLAAIQHFARVRAEARKTAEETTKLFEDIEALRRSGRQDDLIKQAEVLEREEIQPKVKQLAVLETRIATLAGQASALAIEGKRKEAEETKALLAAAQQRRAELALEIDLLRARFGVLAQAARTVERQPGTRTGRLGTVTVESTDPQKAAAEAETLAARAQEVLRDLRQGFEDLFTRASTGAVTLVEFDRTVRELGDSFTGKLRKPTDEQAAAFAVLQTQAGQVRETLRDLKAREAADAFDELMASLTPTAVDNLERELGELQVRVARFREAGAVITPEAEERALAILRARIQGAREEEALERTIRGILAQKTDAFVKQIDLQGQINAKSAELASLSGDDAATQVRIKSLLEQIEQLKSEIAKLSGKDGATTKGTVDQTRSWAAELADVANVALGVSTALSGANDELTRAIGATAQLLSGIQAVVAAVQQAGSLSAALSGGAGVLGLLPGIGGIIGGIGAIAGLFGGREDDPEARRRAEILEENNRRLAELRDKLGELVSITVSGRDIGAIADVTTRQITKTGGLTGLEEIEFFRPMDDVLEDLKRAGVTLDELRQAAADFGITLSETPTITELEALQKAIRDFQFSAFTESFRSQLSALRTSFELFDITDPIEQARQFLELMADDKVGAPAIVEALAGFDLTTAEGLAGAQDALRGLFEQFRSGALSAEEFAALLGNLTPDEFQQAIEFLDSALDRAADSARTLADTIAEAFSDIDLDAEIFGRSAEDRITRQLQALGLSGIDIETGRGDFDLQSAGGRAAALEALRELARTTTDRDLLQLIASVVQSLEALPELPGEIVEAIPEGLEQAARRGGGTSAGALQTLTLHQGDRLITLAESQLLVQRGIQAILAAALRPVPAIQPPTIPGFGAGFAAAAAVAPAAGITLHVGPVTVNVPSGTADPMEFGRRVSDGLVDGINRRLADDVVFQRYLRGSRQVS